MTTTPIFLRLLLILVYIPTALLLQGAITKLIAVSSKKSRQFLLFLACVLLSETKIFFGDFFNILPAFAFFLFTVYVSCEGTVFKKTAIALLFFSTAISFNALRDNCLTNSFTLCEQYEKSVLISSASSLLFFLFLFLGTKYFAPDKDYTLSDSMWKLLILLTMPPFCIVFCLVLLYDVSFWDTLSRAYRFHRDYAALLIVSIISFIALLWTITVLARQQKLEQQRVLADMNRHYYETMEQQYFEIRRLKHDMANHLQVLSALPPEEQKRYFDGLLENPAFTQTLHYCGDATVNAVLATKENQITRYGIQFSCSVDIPEELPFSPADICALFANALDNAAEACQKVPEADKKIILESKAQKGLFCLKVLNPTEISGDEINYHTSGPTPHLPGTASRLSGTASRLSETVSRHRDASIPATTKPDKRAHGLGLQSMREIVSRYQGEMELKTENGMAELFLYMPLYNG